MRITSEAVTLSGREGLPRWAWKIESDGGRSGFTGYGPRSVPIHWAAMRGDQDKNIENDNGTSGRGRE